MAVKGAGRVTAVLGPTNTGKTHYAFEEMLSHETGVMGFPLRLLARENYDKAVQKVGKNAAALVTGEEKIIPPCARYFFCTVESMPIEQEFDFLAVDEIQLCADPERGHIFTDRLLRARGLEHTMFLGADTIKPMIRALVPNAEFVSRERLSQLTYTGFRKMTRLPKRSAVVAFSISDVYAMADLIRRHRGGTAVVLGALSPRARNKQVGMYQSGEVDFMVATDAIGMGLNMDISHVALAATRKFDGYRPRNLRRAELAQIAGRAGRYKRDGTFGVTGNIPELDDDVVEAIQTHTFNPLEEISWRNSVLDYSSPKALLQSLERKSGNPVLVHGRPSEDYLTLSELAGREDIAARATNPDTVRLLWEVCQIPDFQKILNDTHEQLVAEIYGHLVNGGLEGGIHPLPEDWMESHIARLDSVEGDVDTIMARISNIRTWTYITHRKDWMNDPEHWQRRTLAIEDRLSDALHEALIKRFVDQRSSVLIQAVEDGRQLLAGIKKDGEVVVEGQRVGFLDGFRFIPDETSGREEYKAIMRAAKSALRPEIKSRVGMITTSIDKQFTLGEDGQVHWQKDPTNPLTGPVIGRVQKGDDILKPKFLLEAADDLLDGQDKGAVETHVQGWLDRHLRDVLAPLFKLADENGIEGQAKGIAYQVYEALGIIPREDVQDLIDGLDETGRAALRARRLRMGPLLCYLPELNKPASVRLQALVWNLWHGLELPAIVPKDGIVSFSIKDQKIDEKYYRAIGYPVYGPRSIRVDMLDRVVCAVYDNAKEGKFQAQHQMAEWLGSNIADLYEVLEAMGHKKIHDPLEEKLKAEAEQADKPEEAKAQEEPKADPEKKEEKPELATFALKRGKASEKAKPRQPKQSQSFKKQKPKKPHKAKRPGEPKPKSIQTGPAPKPEDSPFAILQQLKLGNDKD